MAGEPARRRCSAACSSNPGASGSAASRKSARRFSRSTTPSAGSRSSRLPKAACRVRRRAARAVRDLRQRRATGTRPGSHEVLAKARQSGVFAFVNKDLRFSRPEVGVSIDRELAARLGISMEDIGRTLQIMLGEVETNRFSIEGRSYKVIPQADRGFRLTKEWLERYYVRTESGTLVPLSTVISLKQEVKPNTLRQFQQLNSVTIGGLDAAAELARRRARISRAGAARSGAGRIPRRITRASRAASCRRARVSCCCSAARSCSSIWCCRRSSTASAIPSSCSSACRCRSSARWCRWRWA